MVTLSLGRRGMAAPNTRILNTTVAPKGMVGMPGKRNFWGNIGGVAALAITEHIAHVTGSFVLALNFTGFILLLGIGAYLFLIPGRIPEPVDSEDALGVRV